jgi:sugar lactone lactonase YvrE
MFALSPLWGVIRTKGSEVLQTIDVDRGCFACMLGGPDRRTLFIVASEWRGMEKILKSSKPGLVSS